MDQSALFLATIRLCDRVNGIYGAYMRKKQEALDKAQADLENLTRND